MQRGSLIAAAIGAIAALASAADGALAAKPFIDKTIEVKVTEDVKFGIGETGWSSNPGSPATMPLLLDVYEPVQEAGLPRPALILAHGGSYHRGSRKTDEVDEGGSKNTSIAEYCREFARRGYVCFSIDYRLMQDDPGPGVTPTIPENAVFAVDRINYVRNLLRLPPTDSAAMVREIEAATDDFTLAISFVRARSAFYNVDPARIAGGGFSAGANTAQNSAFAERAPLAAVVPLSGTFVEGVPERFITGAAGEPPLLWFMGEKDLPDLAGALPAATAWMTRVGATYEAVRIPGATHFYPRTASVTAADGSATTIEDRIAEFLFRHLRLSQMGK